MSCAEVLSRSVTTLVPLYDTFPLLGIMPERAQNYFEFHKAPNIFRVKTLFLVSYFALLLKH